MKHLLFPLTWEQISMKIKLYNKKGNLYYFYYGFVH